MNYVDAWGLMKSENNDGELIDIAKSWVQKESGETLTNQEAEFQRAVGTVEMVLGGGGLFSGIAPRTSAFVMADGAHVLASANNDTKANPGDLYLDLINPIMNLQNNSSNVFTSPIP